MAYIGTQPLAGQYRKLDDISSGFNGATTSFTTSVGGTNVTAGSPQQLLVSLGGVIQQPTVDYTVNTSTITFTTAPASGLSFFAVLMGDALNTSVPADGSITSAKLAGSLSVGLAAGSASTPSLFFTGDTNTGIYSPGADQVAISTGGSGRLFVDSSGRVGIGTTAPGCLLEVKGGSAITTLANSYTNCGILHQYSASTLLAIGNDGTSPVIQGVNATNNTSRDVALQPLGGRVLVGTSNYTGNSKFVVAGLIGGDVGLLDLRYTGSRPTAADITVSEIRFGSSDLTANTAYARIIAESDGASSSGSDIPGRLVFSTTADGASSPTERMRIANDGKIGIGTTSLSSGLISVGGSGNSTWGYAIRDGITWYHNPTIPSGSATVQNFSYQGATVGSITITTTATSYNTSSDYRLKEHIIPVTDGITRLQQLKPSRFNFIADPDKTVDGFIAHEVQDIVPEAISGEKDAVDADGNPEYQGIDQSKLVPLLTAALQEAIGRIETLEAEVAALKAQ